MCRCLLSVMVAVQLELTMAACGGSFRSCKILTNQHDCDFRAGCEWAADASPKYTCQGSPACERNANQKDCEGDTARICKWADQSGLRAKDEPVRKKHEPSAGSYCFGKPDGQYCQSANEVVTCQDSTQTDYQYCSSVQCESHLLLCPTKFCDTQLPTATCGSPQFCKGKLDGSFCEGKVLKVCSKGNVVSSLECLDAGCTERCKVRLGITETSQCIGQSTCGFANLCADGLQISYCDSGAIKTCPGNTISEVCRDGTCKDWLGKATCGDPRFCEAKLDGNHCDGKYLKTCSAETGRLGVETGRQYCGSTCSAGTGVGKDECGTAGFCLAKSDGSYCDDIVWKSCKASTMDSSTWCEGGCRSAGIHAAECGSSSGNVTHVSFGERMGTKAAAVAIAAPRTIAQRVSLHVAEAEASSS